MANIKSAIKRAKLSKAKNFENASARSALKTSIKRFEETLTTDPDQAQQALRSASRSLDKAASKGLIHKNKAARKKSRLTKRLAKVAG
ncbi:MAG: 30S ribosomal protein S20 [Peptococcaceae bacterium]|nr:30S ribosomal protein S20 [Peptococcaceae bacterium]